MNELNALQKELFSMQDKEYAQFHSKLMPGIPPEKIIGVRTPALRKFAKEYAHSSDKDFFLSVLPHTYYEENNLHALLLMQEKDTGRLFYEIDRFLPYVDNWATCDLFSPPVFKKHPPQLLSKVQDWIHSDRTYTIRFGIGVLLSFYLDEAFSPEQLLWVAEIQSEEYYVRMMQAWYFATALAKQYEQTLPYLTENRLNRWVHNKTIQKAVESYRITEAQKAFFKTLRRKKE